mgnify:CR=1 FL=1
MLDNSVEIITKEEEDIGNLTDIKDKVYKKIIRRKKYSYFLKAVTAAGSICLVTGGIVLAKTILSPGGKVEKTESLEKEHTFYEKDTEKGNIEIKEIPVKPLHDLKTIKGKFSKITSEEFYKELKKEDYYRAVLTDEDDILNAIGKLKSIYPNLMSMEYDNTRTRSYSVVDNVETGETKSPLDYFEEFFEKQNGRKMSEKQRNYLLEILGEAREESHETN